MKLYIIYHDGTYDEGTHDEIAARRGDRLSASEVEIHEGRELPIEFTIARQISSETKEERLARLSNLTLEDLASEIVNGRINSEALELISSRAVEAIPNAQERERVRETRDNEIRAIRNISNRLEKEETSNSKSILVPETKEPVSKLYYLLALINWLSAFYGLWYISNI